MHRKPGWVARALDHATRKISKRQSKSPGRRTYVSEADVDAQIRRRGIDIGIDIKTPRCGDQQLHSDIGEYKDQRSPAIAQTYKPPPTAKIDTTVSERKKRQALATLEIIPLGWYYMKT